MIPSAALSDEAKPALATTAEVRALSPAEAAEERPVHLSGVITFAPEGGICFVHDHTGGIYISPSAIHPSSQTLQTGDQVEIDGFTGPGGFLPIVTAPVSGAVTFRVKGRGPLPKPRRVASGELENPDLDCEWVELEGSIRFLWSGWWRGFGLEIGEKTYPVRLRASPPYDQYPEEWFAGPVRVSAVAATIFNKGRQMTSRVFHVPGAEYIEPLNPSRSDTLFQLPASDLGSLFRVDARSGDRPVRLRGTVTMAELGRGLFLRSEGAAAWVESAQPALLAPGDIVDVVGWPRLGRFQPELRRAIHRRIGREAPPAPKRVTLANVLDGENEADLVSLRAEIIGQSRVSDGWRLVLRAEKTIFEAEFRDPGPKSSTPPIVNGSIVDVAGICKGMPTTGYSLPVRAGTFALTMRGADDLTLVQAPPWWNTQSLLWILSAIGAVGAIVSAWAITLRRRVAHQTAIISRQIEQQSILAERQRIARELHDTLEQELAGMSLLLTTAQRHLHAKPMQAERSLEIAQRMLRHSREESRSSIRDLRSLALEKLGLVGAAEELIRPLAESANIPLEVTATGDADGVPQLHASHLVRIAHEAAANAVRHAEASRIFLHFEFQADHAVLTVEDDGRGFDTTQMSDDTKHFGLAGIKERTDKLRGRCLLESAPGTGTRITITIPFEIQSDSGAGPSALS